MSAAAIAAGITLAGSAAQSASQGKMNRKSRRFHEKMWNKTNEYNSPLEQRKRLEKAGLNPNLVYGGSSGATAGTASQPGTPEFEPGSYQAMGQAGAQYIQSQNIKSATEQNEAQTERIKQETVNAGLESVERSIKNSSAALSYKQKAELYQTTVDLQKERLRNLGIDSDFKQAKNVREERVVNETIPKLRQELSNLKKQGKILEQEEVIKKLDAQLYRDYNIRPDDPFYSKIMARILKSININPFKD